jgi:hypothetical protein
MTDKQCAKFMFYVLSYVHDCTVDTEFYPLWLDQYLKDLKNYDGIQSLDEYLNREIR